MKQVENRGESRAKSIELTLRYVYRRLLMFHRRSYDQQDQPGARVSCFRFGRKKSKVRRHGPVQQAKSSTCSRRRDLKEQRYACNIFSHVLSATEAKAQSPNADCSDLLRLVLKSGCGAAESCRRRWHTAVGTASTPFCCAKLQRLVRRVLLALVRLCRA